MQSISSEAENPSPFSGAKLFLFLGSSLVVIRRDDRPDIPFPGHWDLPGGGRDAGETPTMCVLRETHEEVGLRIDREALSWARSYGDGGRTSWMFAAHLPEWNADVLRLGDEGQEVALMSPEEYAANRLSIPHFVVRLTQYLSDLKGGF